MGISRRTMTTMYCESVLLQDIYVNSTSHSHVSRHDWIISKNALNFQPGTCTKHRWCRYTIFQQHNFPTLGRGQWRRCVIIPCIPCHFKVSKILWQNKSNRIALKANSSNILIEDSIFRRGQGIAVGSIGQYNGVYEFVENFIARNCTMIGTR